MISRIGIKNFKAFSSLDLSLTGLTLLTGLNATGKSTTMHGTGRKAWRQSGQPRLRLSTSSARLYAASTTPKPADRYSSTRTPGSRPGWVGCTSAGMWPPGRSSLPTSARSSESVLRPATSPAGLCARSQSRPRRPYRPRNVAMAGLKTAVGYQRREPPASPELVQLLQQRLDHALPRDYRSYPRPRTAGGWRTTTAP